MDVHNWNVFGRRPQFGVRATVLDRVSNYRKEAVSSPAAGSPSRDWSLPPPSHAASFVVEPFGGKAKRRLDIALALLLLPFAILAGIPIALVVLASGGRPIFGHQRIGHNGRTFRCYKFRTMVHDADVKLASLLRDNPNARQQWSSRFKLEDDPRVTGFGSFLRRTGLDEIPQVWNVLRGEMSWVGPRPVTEAELEKYGASLPSYLCCKPGVTGLWQVLRSRDTTYEERVALDARYAERWSILRDLRILAWTIPCLLTGRGFY